ncbi:DUF6688 family protein [Metabacillus litoralis]|uniref:DUF6688 domain-containing protein n=1 Tax=Metabacillus litoralis TaxID=152268 RepID=UPI001CFE3219|nr:DUF6688 family protein [Metabacillus litoralis]
MLIAIGSLFLICLPAYTFVKMLKSFTRKEVAEDYRKVKAKISEGIYLFVVFCVFIIGFYLNSFGIEGGEPLSFYSQTNQYLSGYASLSNEHISSLSILLLLSCFAYQLLATKMGKLSPIVHMICSSILVMNIIVGFIYLTHTGFTHYSEEFFSALSILFLQTSYLSLNFLYISVLKVSIDDYRLEQKKKDRVYHNIILRLLYKFTFHYYKLPIVWIFLLFPCMIIIHMILVLFGQQPDSLIRAFLETSSYNYSKLPEPNPKMIQGDGHYLCTVSLKGHKKIVKPTRSGIRHGTRIVVNRQLLIANAFENIIEQYTPKTHKVIRSIYDQYGYPLSKHIHSSWLADFVYLLMKPLEWLFLFVLYTVDKNPENRIHIQYSELRK